MSSRYRLPPCSYLMGLTRRLSKESRTGLPDGVFARDRSGVVGSLVALGRSLFGGSLAEVLL